MRATTKPAPAGSTPTTDFRPELGLAADTGTLRAAFLRAMEFLAAPLYMRPPSHRLFVKTGDAPPRSSRCGIQADGALPWVDPRLRHCLAPYRRPHLPGVFVPLLLKRHGHQRLLWDRLPRRPGRPADGWEARANRCCNAFGAITMAETLRTAIGGDIRLWQATTWAATTTKHRALIVDCDGPR